MTTKKKQPASTAAPKVLIQNCSFHGDTVDARARLALAEAIRANSEAAHELAKNLAGAALLTIEQPK